MFRKLWNLAFRGLPMLKELDGHKTVVGAVLIVLSGVFSVLTQLVGALPGVEVIVQLHGAMTSFVNAVNPILETLGLGVIYAGVFDKAVKKTE